jgi:hypothetical protein
VLLAEVAGEVTAVARPLPTCTLCVHPPCPRR